MRLTVIGCGYLGAVHAAGMADFGHEVIGIDVDADKIADLAAARAPFFEPGLPELLQRAMDSGRLRFTTDIAEAGASSGGGPTVHFVCVGTPQRKGEFAADTSYVDAAVTSLLPHLNAGDLVVGKSTVPVGTAARLAEGVRSAGADLAWNPEFLREGYAVRDTISPDRLVYGLPQEGLEELRGEDAGRLATESPAARAKALLDEVYLT